MSGENINVEGSEISASSGIMAGAALPASLVRKEELRGESLSYRVRCEPRRSLSPRQRRPRPRGFYRLDRSY